MDYPQLGQYPQL